MRGAMKMEYLPSEMDPRTPVEIGVLEGYSRWAETYDIEANPLIDLEELHVLDMLANDIRPAVDAA